MRSVFSIIFFLLAAILGYGAYFSYHSPKPIGKSVYFLLLALLPPVIGNLVLVTSSSQTFSVIGCYTYFVGMDLAMLALLFFSFHYCRVTWPNHMVRNAVYLLLLVDVIQYCLNPFTHHVFTTTKVMVDHLPYWRMIPLFGQTFHRIIDYGIYFSAVCIFIHKLVNAPQIYQERYLSILIAMFIGGMWQSYYIFSRQPIDKSMIGFAIFGILVFYFSLYYRPVRLLDRLLAGIVSNVSDAVYFLDVSRRCIWANASGCRFAGVESDLPDHAYTRLEQLIGPIQLFNNERLEKRVVGEDESARYYTIEKSSLPDRYGNNTGWVLSVRDETAEQQAIMRDLYNARHDALTGLYTREYLYECIRKKIRDNPDVLYDVVFVDVKEFKIVNDIFGTEFGDLVLKRIAESIREDVPPESLFGRLTGDTFGICISAASFDSFSFRERISNFVVKNGPVEHTILIHLGVYEVTEPDLNPSVMFDRAHLALSTIKEDYQTHIAYYDDSMRHKVLWNQHISNQADAAIAENQIQPFLQPIMDREGRMVGAEALVRWIHPTDGFLPPSAFIPVFEKNGIIAMVDRHMWRSACAVLARWQKQGIDAFISVNISPKDFYFMNVPAVLLSIVEEFGIDRTKLRLEITETVMMADKEKRMNLLSELKSYGFIIEMDDFGSGYSSLNMLKDMPVDVLKIDMAFLEKTENTQKASIIVNNIIRLSNELQICTLTEGVETEKQVSELLKMGCRLLQGYYFSRPLSVTDFENRFLRSTPA